MRPMHLSPRCFIRFVSNNNSSNVLSIAVRHRHPLRVPTMVVPSAHPSLSDDDNGTRFCRRMWTGCSMHRALVFLDRLMVPIVG